jgi:hypothetical protein
MENTNKTNSLAIAGFILSFIFALVGLILSIIGFKQVKKTGEKGNGLAVAGIVISSLSIVTSAIITVFVFVLGTGFVNQVQLYNNAITDVNQPITSYNRLVTLETGSVDTGDVDSVKTAAGNDAAKIRQVIAELESEIDILGKNEVFSKDTKAKQLYDNLVAKFAGFEDAYSEAATIYERIAQGDFEAAYELEDIDLLGNDIDTELNALNQYLVQKAGNLE